MSSRKSTRRRYEEGRARRNVSIPGALIGAIEKRIEELGKSNDIDGSKRITVGQETIFRGSNYAK